MSKSREIHKVKIGLLGSGTVGEAVQSFIFGGQAKEKVGMDLEIVKIYTRRPKGKKWYPTHASLFTTKAYEVTDHPEAEIIVEALGSQEEGELSAFKDYIIRSLQRGKSVVTSDKAVLAKFGREIWAAAREYKQALRFEACVGGGIPIIRSLSESFSSEQPESIYGIINGTCNYVLSEMGKGGKSYAEALKDAQGRGYAETNPKADTSGMDAEAKLILLTLVTFGLHVEPGVIWRKGIEEIDAIDFLYADRKGSCTIKQLAAAQDVDGTVQAFVSPVLVPHGHFLATIEGATNAIFFKGKQSQGAVGAEKDEDHRKTPDWNYVFVGPGAGGGPTGVAILGDVCDLARGRVRPLPAPPSLVCPGKLEVQSEDDINADFYLRFVVKDRAGIVGDICQTLGEQGINIAEVWQLPHGQDELKSLAQRYGLREKPGKILPFVITLDRAAVGQIRKALANIRQRDFILVDPLWIPIWRN
jgi:homoserine dehydrogenase